MPLSTRLYCKSCQRACKIVKWKEEDNYQTSTFYLSSCCAEPIVDELDKPLMLGELRSAYETQQSYEVEPIDD